MDAGNCSSLRTNKITTNKSNRKTQKHKLIHSKKISSTVEAGSFKCKIENRQGGCFCMGEGRGWMKFEYIRTYVYFPLSISAQHPATFHLLSPVRQHSYHFFFFSWWKIHGVRICLSRSEIKLKIILAHFSRVFSHFRMQNVDVLKKQRNWDEIFTRYSAASHRTKETTTSMKKNWTKKNSTSFYLNRRYIKI